MQGPLPTDYRTFNTDLVHETRVEKFLMQFGAADRLSVFEDYKFFTPAILYLFGRFSDRVWAQMMGDTQRDVTLMHYRFARPLFCGLQAPDGDTDWNHVLWAVPSEDWPALENYLLSVVFLDTPNRAVYRIGAQDVDIADPLYVDLNSIVTPNTPKIKVTVFGVDSSNSCLALSRVDGVLLKPGLVRYPPLAKTVDFARTLFDTDRPGKAIDVLDKGQ